jgi:glc operon protein GlcG
MPIRNSRSLTGKGAHLIMDAALAKARELGIDVTVAIVDAGGHLLLLERMEGSPFHTVHSCSAKAVCAASNRRPTGSRGAQGQTLEDVQVLSLTLAAGPKNWTAINGGWPIMVGTECLGGIGVSGGTRKQDAEIAAAALDALGTIDAE